MTGAQLKKAAIKELERRRARNPTAIIDQLGITPESLSAGHGPQLKMIRDTSSYLIVLCSRRAGKTYGLACLALLTALRRPRQNILYVGLSKPHARKFLWNEVWCPLLDGLKVPHSRNETDMTTTFPNGSVMYVSGTDDVRHIESFLGNRLNLAIVDEAQSQTDSVLVPLSTRILPNALLDDMDHPGQLVMSGTIPEVDAGRFMEVWREGKWSQHNWSRFDNPHLKDQEAALLLYLEANPGMTADGPEVQREWRGKFVFDAKATAYGYRPDLAGYVGVEPSWLSEVECPSGRIWAAEPHEGINTFACAIDPASEVDRVAMEVWGWGDDTPEIQHVFDWTSAKGAGLTWGQMASVGAHVQRHFAPDFWFYDAGSSKNELDTFTADYGIPVIRAANKADLPGQVRRMKDLLNKGNCKVIRGSALEEDLMKARRDFTAGSAGAWKWANAWHPDPSEAARYALQGYFASYEAPVVKTDADRRLERVREASARMNPSVDDEDVSDEEGGAWGEDGDAW